MLMFNSNDVQLQNLTRNSLVKVSRVLNDPKVNHSNCTNFLYCPINYLQQFRCTLPTKVVKN